MCEELNRLKREAALAQLEGKKIRKSRDLTFREDAELTREQHRKLDAVLKHQLVGHDGKPCPDGFPWANKPAPQTPQKSNFLKKRRKA
jgi:hypothetical protein